MDWRKRGIGVPVWLGVREGVAAAALPDDGNDRSHSGMLLRGIHQRQASVYMCVCVCVFFVHIYMCVCFCVPVCLCVRVSVFVLVCASAVMMVIGTATLLKLPLSPPSPSPIAWGAGEPCRSAACWGCLRLWLWRSCVGSPSCWFCGSSWAYPWGWSCSPPSISVSSDSAVRFRHHYLAHVWYLLHWNTWVCFNCLHSLKSIVAFFLLLFFKSLFLY